MSYQERGSRYSRLKDWRLGFRVKIGSNPVPEDISLAQRVEPTEQLLKKVQELEAVKDGEENAEARSSE